MQNNISFMGAKKSIADSLMNRITRVNPNTLSKEDRMIQHQRGLFAGMDAKRSVDECREIIIRETLAGNFDYLKGFNQAIGKDMAKKAYSSIGKGV
jgi:hypothetical protein